jgi:2-methylcitrate dehydratase PrpD
MKYTKLLSDYVYNLKYDDLPKEVIEQVKHLTLQVLGASLAAYPTSQAQKAIEISKTQGGKPESTIVGDGCKIPATEAAFVNGTMADILDWEDCSWTGHPSAGSIPAALSVAEAKKLSGREYISSVVAGYEVYQRIAMSVQPSLARIAKVKSWGLVSWQIYSAVVPAAKLLNLSADKISQALGVALYQTAIPCNKHANPTIGKSDVYHYAHGFNARDGIFSAIIAESGIEGMYDALDGEDGYWAQVSDQVDWEWLTRDLGKKYLIMETLFKHWPANMWIQGPLDALDFLVKENNIDLSDIKEITLSPTTDMTMTFDAKGYHGALDAQFSVPYCFAVYLLDHEPKASWFSEDKLNDKKVLEIASKVKGAGPTVTPFQQFHEFWKGSFPLISVKILLKNGKEYKKELRFPKGHPRNMMTVEELKDRFVLQASSILEPDILYNLIENILNIENISDISEVTKLLHK